MRAMIPVEEPFEDRFASLLAQYQSELTAGAPADTSRFSSLTDPRLAGRLVKAGECLELLEQVWPRPRAIAPDGEPLPQAIDRFEIIRELGRGGFGIVYLAYDPVLRREIALKMQRPETVLSPELRRRFLGEAQAAGALNHSNIVAVYEVGESSVLGWIAVEYCPGMSLSQWLARWRTPVPPRLAAEMAAQLADAVAYAHGRGVLHRDIKPSNVLLTAASDRVARPERTWGAAQEKQVTVGIEQNGAPSTPITGHQGVPPQQTPPEPCFDGGGAPCPPEASALAREAVAFISNTRPKLTDFGLAKVLDGDAVETKSGTLIGTPGYMAPEQIESTTGEVGPATDVYGLGLVLYEMLTAKAAFAGTTRAETFKRVLLEEPAAPRKLCRQVPRDLQAITLEAISKNPDQRYFSAAELAIDLRRYLADKPVRARQPRWYEHAWRFVRRRPAWLTAATLLVIAGCLIAAVARYAAENHALLGYQQVSFTTKPEHARVAFVPLNPVTGEPEPSKAVRPSKRTPVHVELLPGDYFVVVALDEERFHEVYRHVPRDKRAPNSGHLDTVEFRGDEIVLAAVVIPPASVKHEMALVRASASESKGDVAPSALDFYMDQREVSIADYGRALSGSGDRTDTTADPNGSRAMTISFDRAAVFAERVGKRLPTLAEYRVAATHRTARAASPGDCAAAVAEFGDVGTPLDDSTDTTPPIYGLFSNVAEWTATRPLAGEPDGRLVFGGDESVVRGSATLASEHRDAGKPFVADRRLEAPGLGFRCVRSARARWLGDEVPGVTGGEAP
jgi:serine/threonine protein kinase/formylglycine-generating enzyme required for sulfatase activity